MILQIAALALLLSTPITPSYFLANKNTKELQKQTFSKSSAREKLFSPSKFLSEKEIEKCQSNEKIDMTYSEDGEQIFRFVTSNEGVWYELCFVNSIPEFLKGYQALFEKEDKWIEGELKKVWTYSIYDGTDQLKSYIKEAKKTLLTAFSPGYTLGPRRAFKGAKPRLIQIGELKKVLTESQSLLYTGAGVSVAANVPSLRELYPLLGIEKNNLEPFFNRAICHPRELIKSLKLFHKSCFYHKPTKAHYTLTQIAEESQRVILTENLDSLHEQTGIEPLRVSAESFKALIDPSTLGQIDSIICIGLSHDDKGFLGWYKKHHPGGKIIAIDLQQPEYLGDEDYWLNEDLQKVFSGI